MIEVNNVSMRFNMAKEKHESLKEYFLAAVQGKLQFEEFYALRDVSLTVHKGEFHGIIGLNGSGKSTLLKVISGVFKPTAWWCTAASRRSLSWARGSTWTSPPGRTSISTARCWA